MVKKDFIEIIARETGLNKAIVRLVLDRFLLEMRNSLLRYERIELRNFGVFTPQKSCPKVGRNLKTGEQVSIPSQWKIRFKPSRYFSRLNKKE